MASSRVAPDVLIGVTFDPISKICSTLFMYYTTFAVALIVGIMHTTVVAVLDMLARYV